MKKFAKTLALFLSMDLLELAKYHVKNVSLTITFVQEQ